MHTHFASPARTSQQELLVEIDMASHNAVISEMLQSVSGLLAILDENRQIISLNDAFLKVLGIKDAHEVFGLRPGEAVHCIHAGAESGGCGTSKYCSSCGAAVAIVSALEHGCSEERTCSISTELHGHSTDLFFSVKASPLKLNNKLFILLFLQDKTADQQRTALERTFFHDVSNMLQILVGASELLIATNTSPLAKTIHQASLMLQDEIAIQRCLSQHNAIRYQPVLRRISTRDIISDMQLFFANHPLTKSRKINYSLCPAENVDFTTDYSLLWRILHNMLLNALEATKDGEEVKTWFEKTGAILTFKVWNMSVIDEKVTNRIFERNFTTKNNSGRGLGTYSMKYFGEQILGGTVAFSSAPELGTTFWFAIDIT